MKFKVAVNVAEVRPTKTGKRYLEVITINGDKYSCWEEILWPEIQNSIGTELEIDVMDSGRYKNIVGAGNIMSAGNYFTAKPTKTQQINQAQDRKAGYIKEAQERKEESIAYFNSLNNAIAFLSATMQGKFTLTQVYEVQKEMFKRWQGEQ